MGTKRQAQAEYAVAVGKRFVVGFRYPTPDESDEVRDGEVRFVGRSAAMLGPRGMTWPRQDAAEAIARAVNGKAVPAIEAQQDDVEETGMAKIDSMRDKLKKAAEALIAEIEADEVSDAAEVRQDLTELHQQFVELAKRARSKLADARETHARAEKAVEHAQEFVDKFDSVADELDELAEQLDPAAWDWTDQ